MLNYRIAFNKKDAEFYPNSEVTATVHLETDRIMKVRKIDLNIVGFAKTEWHEWRERYERFGSERHMERIRYSSKIKHINLYAILWKSPDGKNLLQPGKYSFPYTFRIPSNAPPCSLSGEYGEVEYYAQANIDIPWGFDEERIRHFTVYTNLDLNLDSQLSLAVCKSSTEIQDNCCSCSSSSMNLKVRLPKTGYIPGEKIEINVEIKNKTSWKITKIEYGIDEDLLFIGHHEYFFDGRHTKEKTSTEVVASEIATVNSNKNYSRTFTLTVPELEPTYDECPIMSLEYSLYVKIFTDAVFSSGPQVLIPITIGSIPIRALHVPSPSISPSSVARKKESVENLKSPKSGKSKKTTVEKDNLEVAVSPMVQDKIEKKM